MKKMKRLYNFYIRHVSVEDTTSLAYYFILSLIPAITLVTTFARFLHYDIESISTLIEKIFTKDVADIVLNLLVSQEVSYYSIITLVVCLYVCSKGIFRVTRSVDYMYKVDPKPYLPARINAAFNTLLLVVLILGLMIILTVLPMFFSLLKLNPLWSIVQYGGGFFFILMIMLMMFKVLPSTSLSFKEVYKGAFVTSLLFLLIIFGFSIYLRFANYTTIYGPFASIAVLLLVFDFFSKAIYLGFAVNALNQYTM